MGGVAKSKEREREREKERRREREREGGERCAKKVGEGVCAKQCG